MNLEKLENLLHACLALSLAVGLLFVAAAPAKAASTTGSPTATLMDCR